MRGHENAAILPGGCQTENMVVLIDGAAHGAEAVMAVGEHIGQRKFPEARSAGGLNDAHIGDVVGSQGIKTDMRLSVMRCVRGLVCRKNARGQRIARGGGEVDAPGLRFGGAQERSFIDDGFFGGTTDHRRLLYRNMELPGATLPARRQA